MVDFVCTIIAPMKEQFGEASNNGNLPIKWRGSGLVSLAVYKPIQIVEDPLPRRRRPTPLALSNG
jgi:hypothetical protein